MKLHFCNLVTFKPENGWSGQPSLLAEVLFLVFEQQMASGNIVSNIPRCVSLAVVFIVSSFSEKSYPPIPQNKFITPTLFHRFGTSILLL